LFFETLVIETPTSKVTSRIIGSDPWYSATSSQGELAA